MDNYGPNNDGIDVECCRNVLIEHCEFNTGDESVPLCHWLMKQRHGTLSIGSDISGDVRDVHIHHCGTRGNDRGLMFESTRDRCDLHLSSKYATL